VKGLGTWSESGYKGKGSEGFEATLPSEELRFSFESEAVFRSVDDPAADGVSDTPDPRHWGVVVIPAEGFDFFEDIGIWEVFDKFVDKGHVDDHVKRARS